MFSRVRILKVILAATCFLLVLSITSPKTGLAQVQDNRWTDPFRLSSDEGQADEPIMVSDQYGYVHVFWTETGFPDDRAIIQYARFDGYNWSAPIDIEFTPPNIPINVITAAVDNQGMLHVMSSLGDYGPVFYTSAPALTSTSAHQWSTPVRMKIPAYKMRLQIDSKGVFHLLYSRLSGTEPGVYYIRSENQGQTWSEPIWLDPDMPITLSPSVLQLEIGKNDSLHALWYYVDLNNPTVPGRWIRYSHSLDGGQTWLSPATIDRVDNTSDDLRLPYPLMRVQGDTVHVIWAGDYATHRKHRYSLDGGQTWSQPSFIMGDLIGQALGDGGAIDSKGRLHFFSQIRWPQGIYYSMWDNGNWTAPSMIYLIAKDAADPIGDRIHAHRLRLAIQGGNQLVLCFTTAPSQPQSILYCMQRTLLDLPAAQVAPTPAPTPTPTDISLFEPVSTPTQMPSPTPLPTFDLPTQVVPFEVNTTFNIILLGLIPTLVVLFGFLIYWFSFRRHP